VFQSTGLFGVKVTKASLTRRSLRGASLSEIEKKRTPLEYEIHVKPGIVEGIVDQRTRCCLHTLKFSDRSV